MYENHVEVKLNVVSFVFEGLESGDQIKKKRNYLYVKNSQACYHKFLRERGYEYNREVSKYGMGTK